MLTLLLLLLAQTHDHEADDGHTITPIPEGSVVHQSNFTITVPPGVFLASEEDVHKFFGLFNTSSIPNCVGVFFSSSGEWEYGVAVQFYDNVALGPVPTDPAATLTDYLSSVHPLTLNPLDYPGQMLFAPTFNSDQQSFSYGIAVDSGNLKGTLIKKMFFAGGESLVLSVKANEQSFDNHNEAIMSILDSVQATVPVSGENLGKENALSFLDMLGAKLTPKPGSAPLQVQAGATAEEPILPLPALIGGLLGLVLLAVALFLKGRHQSEQAPSSDA